MANGFMKAARVGALSCLVLAFGCGDDAGDDDGSDDDDDSSPQTDAGGYTLEDALETEGVDLDTRRPTLLFPESCKKQMACDNASVSSCVSTTTTMYNSGKAAGYDNACLDATLDLYACFATHDCEKFDEDCNDAGEKQIAACGKYDADAGD